MLQAHSFLWNYLWVAPNLLLLVLAALLWKRGTWRQIPAFLAFTILSALCDLAVFTADVVPSVSALTFWRVVWASLLVESLLKFIVIGEIFSRVLTPYPSISKLGRTLVTGFGVALVFIASLTAAFSHGDSAQLLISGAHLLEQTVFIIELGLILTVFLFAHYFHLTWDRLSFGVLLGFGLSACAHLTGWAISANTPTSAHIRTLTDFFHMGTHHVCVLIWFYYLLVPPKENSRPKVLPRDPFPGTSGGDLDDWNRELERLVHP